MRVRAEKRKELKNLVIENNFESLERAVVAISGSKLTDLGIRHLKFLMECMCDDVFDFLADIGD